MRAFLLVLSLLPTLARAGLDGYFVVERTFGRVEVARTTGAPWRIARCGTVVSPSMEIRTGPRSRVVLQTGDALRDPRLLDSDERVDRIELGSLGRARAHSPQAFRGVPLFEAIRGKTRRWSEHGHRFNHRGR